MNEMRQSTDCLRGLLCFCLQGQEKHLWQKSQLAEPRTVSCGHRHHPLHSAPHGTRPSSTKPAIGKRNKQTNKQALEALAAGPTRSHRHGGSVHLSVGMGVETARGGAEVEDAVRRISFSKMCEHACVGVCDVSVCVETFELRAVDGKSMW
jgi:hypothetical protein